MAVGLTLGQTLWSPAVSLSLCDPFLFSCHCISLLSSHSLPGSFFQDVFSDFLSVPKNELGVSLDKWPSLKSPVIKSRLKCYGLTCCLTERHSNPDRTRETRVINTTIILLKVYMRHSIDNVDSVLSVMFILCKLAKQLLPPYHPVQSPVDNQEQETKRALRTMVEGQSRPRHSVPMRWCRVESLVSFTGIHILSSFLYKSLPCSALEYTQ